MPPFGWKKIRPGPGELLNAEQVELLAELAVVALLGLFEPLQVLFELFRREERGAIDALHPMVLLVALPIGAERWRAV